MGVFDDLMKSTKNELGGVASKGVITGDSTTWLDSGSYALNALISGSLFGGFPMGKVSGLNAPQAAGKTFFLLTTVKEFLDKNPTGAVFYFESESAVSKQMLEERGIDTKRVYVLPVTTIQEFRNQAIKILDGYKASGKTREDRPPMIMCLDSLGMLSTSKEVEDIAEGKDTRDMTRTQLIKGAFRVLTLKLGEVDVPLILTNHVYACLTPGHKIKTQNGLVEIQNLNVGDLVLTSEGYQPVQNKFRFEDAKTIKLTLEDGNVLECTHNHKFFDKKHREWIAAGDLELDADISMEGESIQGFEK